MYDIKNLKNRKDSSLHNGGTYEKGRELYKYQKDFGGDGINQCE